MVSRVLELTYTWIEGNTSESHVFVKYNELQEIASFYKVTKKIKEPYIKTTIDDI